MQEEYTYAMRCCASVRCLFTGAAPAGVSPLYASVMVSACRCLNHGVFFCPYFRKSKILMRRWSALRSWLVNELMTLEFSLKISSRIAWRSSTGTLVSGKFPKIRNALEKLLFSVVHICIAFLPAAAVRFLCIVCSVTISE